MQVARLGGEVQKARDDLADRVARLHVGHGGDAVGGVEIGLDLAEQDRRAVVLADFLHGARLVLGRDLLVHRDDVEVVHGLVVLAHVVVALGRALVVVERDAGRDHVEEGRALVRERALDERHELLLVAGEAARDVRGAELQRHEHEVDALVGVDRAALRLRAAVGCRGELSLGEPVDAVVFDDVGHVHAAAHDVRELPDADRGRVAVARYAEVDQVAVGEVRARDDRRHASMHAVEAVRLVEEVGRCLRRAADARELRHAVRLDRELPARLDDGGADRVVPASRAQRRHRALVVAAREPDRVHRQVRMVQLRLG